MILLGDLERLRKPQPREAVTWFPNQWVAVVDLEPTSYFPARGEGHWERRKVVFHISIRHLEGNNLLQRDRTGLYTVLIT